MLALVIALALGIVFGVLSVSRIPVLRGITRVYVEVVQNVPLLLQVFVFYAIFPLLGLSLAAFWIGVLAIGIYHGGYISEVVRSGIGSIHRGQFEAAKSQGLSLIHICLDVLTAKTVTDFLLELAADGRTVLLSTHIFSLVEKVCDRVGVVIDGRMAASGTLSEVAGERSLEDAFFDLYAASVKEAS